MKTLIVCLSFVSIAGAEMAPVASNAIPVTAPAKSSVTIPDTNLTLSPETTDIEEGKALYENGQMIAALGKFMTVLRNDPHNAEARQYLRMIVDLMRQNPAISASKIGSQDQALATNPAVQEEIRRMLQLRSRLTLDLKAIPAVQVEVKGNVNQVRIETAQLFADNSGGLKEQGIPVLDRVSAWLKTYGQQPVIIHCYPEELQEASTNGSLFLHRYSELFNFFVDEKKLPAQRFVSADLLNTSSPADSGRGSMDSPPLAAGNDDNKTPRIVIETIGSQSAMIEGMPSMNSSRALSQWLENSITLNRKTFNPEEGEWVNLDLAALTRMGLRNWSVSIMPAQGKSSKPTFQMDGKGNLLKRLSWDGHDQTTGDFVRAGTYDVKLVAVNTDGVVKTLEEILQVERTTKDESTALVNKPKPVKKVAKKQKPQKAVEVVKAPTVKNDDSDSLVDSKPVTNSSSPAATGGGSNTSVQDGSPTETLGDDGQGGDAAHAIWKQVVQFEPGQSALMPTVKSSLERIGKTLEVYPLQKVRITGFAMASEPNAADLAKQRAEAVRAILVDEYHVDTKRVIIAGGKTTTDENASKVEMSITN